MAPVLKHSPIAKPICGKLGVEAAASRRGVFERHQHRASPFAAHGKALRQPQHHHHDRRGNADGGIGRHQADQERRKAHHRQGEHQQRLAPQAVAEMAEEGATDRTRQKADCEGGIGEQQRHSRIVGGKVQLVEDQAGQRGVQDEIVPLDGRADQAGGSSQPDGPQAFAFVVWLCAKVNRSFAGHVVPHSDDSRAVGASACGAD